MTGDDRSADRAAGIEPPSAPAAGTGAASLSRRDPLGLAAGSRAPPAPRPPPAAPSRPSRRSPARCSFRYPSARRCRRYSRRRTRGVFDSVPIQMSTSPGSTPKCSADAAAARRRARRAHAPRRPSASAVAPRQRDEGGEVGHVAIHAVMALDDDQGAAVPRAAARASSLSRPSGRYGRRRSAGRPTAGRPRRCCCGSARRGRSGRAAEQRADDRDVGGVAADQGDAASVP